MRTVRRNPLWIYPKLLPAEICDDLIKYGSNELENDAGVINAGADSDNEFRRGAVAWIPKGHWINTQILSWVVQANMDAEWHFSIHGKEDIQFATYTDAKKGDFYEWHKDETDFEAPFNRKLSVSVQLSDHTTYKGGDLKFKDIDGTELAPINSMRYQGTVIIFPSFLEHKVSPVTKGTRYSLVQWFYGPEFT